MSSNLQKDEKGVQRRKHGRQAREAAKKKKKKMVTLVVVEVIILFIVAGAAFAYFYMQNLWDKTETADFRKEDIATNPDLPDSVKERTKGYRTILFFGVDARNNTELVKGVNADTDIICTINEDTGEIKLVSILRDTYLETTDGKHEKLTDIYCHYGVQEAIQTINRNLDLNITDYVTVNWKAVGDTINLLGGLDIELSSAEAGAVNDYVGEVISKTGLVSDGKIEEYAGVHHLDGAQAVSYARVRSVGLHDVRRAERQRLVISLMLSKAKSAGLGTLNDICNTVFPEVSTNITLSEVVSLMADISSYEISDSGLFPTKYQDQQGGSYFVYCNDLIDNVIELHQFLYENEEYTPSATVKKISQYIDDNKVLNPKS